MPINSFGQRLSGFKTISGFERSAFSNRASDVVPMPTWAK